MHRFSEDKIAHLPRAWVLGLIALALILVPMDISFAAPGSPLKVLVLTDVAGLGDKGFNDMSWRGVERAKRDFGLIARFLQAREQADYLPNLTLAAQNADVVVTLGYLFTDALKQVVPSFPNTKFVHIEGDISGGNIACYDFKSEQGGFLAGLVAGLFTKSGKVGAVSGMDIPPVEAYVSGFRAGVTTAGKKRGRSIEAIVVSAGSFNDPVKGKSLAQALIGQGVDVIFRAAGNTGIGVLEAVKSAPNVYLIAEDLDSDAELPGKILTSTLKRMDVAIYQTLGNIVHGKFQPGHHWLGIAEGGVGITEMKYSSPLFQSEDLQCIQKAKDLIKEGKISVPKTYSELSRFQPPGL